MHILDLPPEITEQILLELDPLDVAAVSQTCSAFYTYIYDSADQRIWRMLYLSQPLDDPRSCSTSLGEPPPTETDWKALLQRVIRARTVIQNPTKCRVEERCTVLRTLLDLVLNLPPAPNVDGDALSLNLVWLAALLRGGSFLEHTQWQMSEEEDQLRSQLHTCFGLTTLDYRPSRRAASRAFVYTMRNYKWDNDFGPFMMDGSGRVNWEHMQTIHHVMSNQIVPATDEPESTVFTIFPMSLPYCQSVIPDGMNLSEENDWAGVSGSWQCSFCFVDQRELLVYNHLDVSIFDDPAFAEFFQSIQVEIHVTSTEDDPSHPMRPKVNFVGTVENQATLIGSVKVTSDDQIRWHFISGEHENPIWSSEGVQVGSVRSPFGILGAWTTFHHLRGDPVGPFWLRKLELAH